MTECIKMSEHVSGPDLRMFVLDVLRHDFEGVSQISTLLNSRSAIGWREFWPRDFSEEEIVGTLASLMQEDLVEVFEEAPESGELERVRYPGTDISSIKRYWYRPSTKGYALWERWDPPVSNK